MNRRIKWRRDASDVQHMLARTFLLLMVCVLALIAGYWLVVLEPQLLANARSTSTALTQSQAHLISSALSENGNKPDAEHLAQVMSEILILKEEISGARFVQAIELELDRDVVTIDADSFPLRMGDSECASCLKVFVPLYGEADSGVLGEAKFTLSNQFYDEFRGVVRSRIFFGSLVMLALLALAWKVVTGLVRNARESDKALQSLFEASPMPMILVKPDEQRVLHANQSAYEFFSVSEDQLPAIRSGDFYANKGERQKVLELLQRDKEMKQYELELLTAKGESRWTLCSAKQVEFAGEQAVILGVTDVSTLKQTERELVSARDAAETADRAKSEFLATMSHEIRTPMNGIMGMVQLLQRSMLDQQQQKYLESIAASGDLLLALLNDVLDLSKIEANKLQLDYCDFDLFDLLSGIMKAYSEVAQQKGVTLSLQVAEEVTGALHGDSLRLRQVLVNLVGNAVKFTEDGRVTLQVDMVQSSPSAIELKFTVSDTGIGIDQDALSLLFKKFVQLDSGIARRYGGTGLGLAISQKLVNAMGGDIGVNSEPGRGSEFFFTIAFKPAMKRLDSAALLSPGVPLDKKLSVLVAEDVPMNRHVVRSLLESEGHSVYEAVDGREAVASLLENEIDVVLMDLHMPEMDGISATREIRKLSDAGKAQVPIIALTANILQQEKDQCRDAGMDGFVVKPFSIDKLLEELGRALHLRDAIHVS